MMRQGYWIRVLHAAVIYLWAPAPVLAAAAVAMARGDSVESVSVALAGVALLLSTLSGVTALLWRVERELRAEPDKPLPRPWLFASSHMACSWLAGALAFALSEAQSLNEWWEVSAVIAASFAGATFVQAAAERMLGKLMPSSMEGGSYKTSDPFQSRYRYPRDRSGDTMNEPRGEVVDTKPGALDSGGKRPRFTRPGDE